jgi:PadR family transcriptional regulator, regulatory protein PadR
MKSRQSDLAPVGSFEEQVMVAVIRTGADAFGMNVRRELETVTDRSITIGSVYATLDRLEAKGLVTSARRASPGDSISRRVFAVTALGAHALADTKAMRERLWDGVELGALPRNA